MKTMTREQYMEFHKKMCNRMIEITAAKNADYTKGSDIDDAFANFRQVEKMGVCSAETGFMARMSDKFSRIASFAKSGQLKVKDESVVDTLLDLANYSILLAGYLQSQGDIETKKKTRRAKRVQRQALGRVDVLKQEAHEVTQ